MTNDQLQELAEKMSAAFKRAGVDLKQELIQEVMAKEGCGSCWNIGCKDGCSSGCHSACKSGQK